MESRRRTERGDPDGSAVRLRTLLAVLLVLAAGTVRPQQPAVVQLHHRSAESLITVLRPLASPATLAGAGMQLQIRTAPSDLARVRHLIEQSDRPLEPLAIALSDEPPGAADVNASTEPPPRNGSITLSTGRPMPPDAVGNGQIVSTQSASRSTAVLEGEPVRISMPAPQSLWFGVHRSREAGARSKTAAAKTSAARTPAAGAGGNVSGATGAQGVVHFDAVSDVTARIWLADTTVAIELQPLAAGGIDAGDDWSSDRAVVYGEVGRWIALADSGADPEPASGSAPRTGLWIKVDVTPDRIEPR